MKRTQFRRVAAVGLPLALTACARTPAVRPVDSLAQAGPDTIVYSLPRTVLTVQSIVSLSRVDPTPPCAPLLAQVGLKRPIIRSGRYLTLHDSLLGVSSEPDPLRRYAVELRGKGASQLDLRLSPSGILSGMSAESRDETLALAVSLASSAVSVAASGVFGASVEGEVGPESTYCNEAASTLKSLREELVLLSTHREPSESAEIVELKQARLATMIKQAEAPFTGVELGGAARVVCELRVDRAGVFPLFAVSSLRGARRLTSGPDGVSCQVPPELWISGSDTAVVEQTTTGAVLEREEYLFLELALAPTGVPGEAEAEPDSDRVRGIHYRVPALASVSVTLRPRLGTQDGAGLPLVGPAQVLVRPSPVAIAQLGVVRSLPVFHVSGSTTLSVRLDTETGALLEARVGQRSADPAGPADVGSQVAEAVSESRGRDQQPEGQESRQALLEAQVAIQAANRAQGQ